MLWRFGCLGVLLALCASCSAGELQRTLRPAQVRRGLLDVSTADELVRAMQAPNESRIDIVLSDDILFTSATPTVQLSTRVTISGPGAPKFTGPGPVNDTGSVTLNFNNLFPLIEVLPGGALELQNLKIAGVISDLDPAVATSRINTVVGFWLWPAILLQPGATAAFRNVIQQATRGYASCAEPALRQLTSQTALGVGDLHSVGYHVNPPSIYITGNHTLSLPVVGPDDNTTTLGLATLGLQGITSLCHVDTLRFSEMGSSDGDSSFPAGAWAGIGVAIAVTCAAAACLVWALLQARKRPQSPLMLTRDGQAPTPFMSSRSSGGLSLASGSKRSMSDPLRLQNQLQPLTEPPQQAMPAPMMRVKFAGLEGLEVNGLLGRGLHGKVYKGTYKGDNVAVKVVEHTVKENATSRPSLPESVLLSTLDHPNIVKVLQVATIRLAGRQSRPRPSVSTATATTSQFTGAATGVLQSEPATASFVTGTSYPGGESGQSGAGPSGIRHSSSFGNSFRSGPQSGGKLPTIAQESSGEADSGSGSDEGPLVVETITDLSLPGVYETWICLEYCQDGSVYAALKRRQFHGLGGHPDLPAVLGVLSDVAAGMHFLHDTAGVIHRDLKAANVLLKRDTITGSLTAVVADFGLSTVIDAGRPAKAHKRHRTAGTTGYVSPELLKDGLLTKGADVWAFGIVMWELYTGRIAYEGMGRRQVYEEVVSKKRCLKAPVGCPEWYAEVLAACLTWEVEERCDFGWVVARLAEVGAGSV